MKKGLLYFALYAIIVYLTGSTLNSAVADLNVGEPHTVRLIYFLPNDRAPQQDIDTKLDTLIREVQQFYADEMERHGFEGKTFTFETNVNGKAAVHHVDGQFTDSHYHQNTAHKVREEIQQQFYAPHRIYAVAIDISSERLCGEAKALPVDRSDKMFVMPASGHCFNLSLAAHELGHTFGLQHDFRNDVYTMSYGKRGRLSKCAAEWLDANRFFNSSQTSFNEPATIQILPPLAYSSNAIRLRFEVTDTDGLHQAQLIIPTTARDPVEGSGIKLHGCKSLRGENSSLEFITTELTVEPATEVILHVIDVYGGITRSRFTFTKDDILPDPTNRIPTTLEKISGDNQHGLSITPLPDPLVVKVIDQNGIAFEEIVVTFAVIAGDGTLSVTRTTTDENGRAQSTLTLGPNLGTNIVEVSAAGITETFNAVAGAAVNLPDANLRAAVENALGKAEGEPIALSEMETLTRLEARDANIRNLTGLEHATNLKDLRLDRNAISDISVLAGLTDLTGLGLDENSISDISALAGLTNLTNLLIGGNNISDISVLAGLTNLRGLSLYNNNISDISAVTELTTLTQLWLDGNNISDISPLVANTGLGVGGEVYLRRWNPLSYHSIHTHIPVLRSRGVTVEFDNRTPTPPLKISGDDQQGTSGMMLTNPFVVEVRDRTGTPFEGVPVTFTVTDGDGTVQPETVPTDENGRAESTLTLGLAGDTNTVHVSVESVSETVTFTANAGIEFDLSIPAGISLIHVPLKVTAVDEMEQTVESVGDLYDALGGASTVNFLITYDSSIQEWRSFFVFSDKGTPADALLADDTGIIAGMKVSTSVQLSGDPLGIDGSSAISLKQGLNIVGLPLRDPRISRVSDLFALDGIGGNVPVIILTDRGEFKAVGRADDPGDIEITGGQSFILTAQRAAIVDISGDAWTNVSGTSAAPQVALTGIEVGNTTPVLGLRGSIADEGTGLNNAGFRVTVKNLSTRSAVSAVTTPDEAGYRSTVVDIETGRAATVGDILEISAQSPNPFIGVQPFQYTVTAEDVKQSLIQLPELVAYEIPAETELLSNYPNPFNPETWIPYRLAEDALVTLTIYDGAGQVVRTLDVGHQVAAVYESRSKAVYWDGRNGLGEQVASGVYFYHLSAGDYSATRKMVILK